MRAADEHSLALAAWSEDRDWTDPAPVEHGWHPSDDPTEVSR